MLDQTISHYKILAKLGEGGMGVVYKAQDIKLNRTVALKFLPLEFTSDSEAVNRFINEAQTASALDHANICTIYEIDETSDGRMFICMAYYDGETLRKKVASNQLSVNSAIDIAKQIANGLARAHEAGIIHRDIKPENIIITMRGEVKIIDFGIAKLAGQSRLTKTGSTLGTIMYMSPEQLHGKEVDHRADIWALGVVIYEMLAGKAPFRGEYEAALLYAIAHEPLEPLIRHRPEISEPLQRVVDRALDKNPDTRYQHIADLLSDLEMVSKGAKTGNAKTGVALLEFGNRSRKLFYIGWGILAIILMLLGLNLFNKSPTAIDSLAVLPFVNVSDAEEMEYLSDGITESLINSFSQLPNLKVMSRNSVFRYKGQKTDAQTVGQQLGVRAVLLGRVIQRSDVLSINTELVDVQDNSQFWGEQYNRKFADILAVQEEIANEISQQLRLKLSGEERKRLTKRYTENTEAYQLYLKGRYYANKFTKEGFDTGIEYLHQAIAMDPNYALAYDGLAYYYYEVADWLLSPREAMPKAKEAAKKAIEIDEILAEAHTSLAVVYLWYDWDRPSAEREFKRAFALNPNYAIAHHYYSAYLVSTARFDEAIAESRRALELDPLSLYINTVLGLNLYFARRYDQAIEQLRKTIDMDPSYWLAHLFLGRVYEQKGRLAEAIEEFQQARRLEDAIPEILAALGHAYARSGKRAEAQSLIEELQERSKQGYVSSYNLATIYIGLDKKDHAFECLEKAYTERSFYLTWLKVNPELDRLRADARFLALLEKIELKP